LKNKKYETQEKTSKTWKKIWMKALPHCKNMKNITITQKNIKNRKNMKNTKYMGRGGSLWKPQLHWLLLLLRLLPLKTVQYLPWPSPFTTKLTYVNIIFRFHRPGQCKIIHKRPHPMPDLHTSIVSGRTRASTNMGLHINGQLKLLLLTCVRNLQTAKSLTKIPCSAIMPNARDEQLQRRMVILHTGIYQEQDVHNDDTCMIWH